MGITGLIPFMEKASRRANVAEFSGCSVAIDSYCWLHKGAFACADKLVRGERTDIHIRYCLKYVNMLLSHNIKPILVFDGRHLPAKAQTETKRRESRETAKKRAVELLKLGQTNEARSMMRRGVDITHEMALELIKECRAIGVDCIVAPYEADAQLAYLNRKNIAQVVITEDSDLVLFGCSKILFKMDLEGNGTLVDCSKLALTMKCPIERYSLDKFRRVCIMSGCDYVSSLPGIGLVKAAQFVAPIQDTNFANALKKLPSFFNKNIKVTPEYIDNFLKAEATFKHQFVYDPIDRCMTRLNDPEEEGTDLELCCNAGERLDEVIAFQLALGNLDPFSLRKMDDWHPDHRNTRLKTSSWSSSGTPKHPSIWQPDFVQHLSSDKPWKKKAVTKETRNGFSVETRARDKVVNVIVPETQDCGISIETLSSMYHVEPPSKKVRQTSPEIHKQNVLKQTQTRTTLTETQIIEEISDNRKSPILKNKDRSFRRNGFYKRISQTSISTDLVESDFFKTGYTNTPSNSSEVKSHSNDSSANDDDSLSNSQKENNCRNPFKINLASDELLDDSKNVDDLIENTYPMEELITPICSQSSFGRTPQDSYNEQTDSHNDRTEQYSDVKDATSLRQFSKEWKSKSKMTTVKPMTVSGKSGGKGAGPPKRPQNQPTLLEKFGFKKRTAVKM